MLLVRDKVREDEVVRREEIRVRNLMKSVIIRDESPDHHEDVGLLNEESFAVRRFKEHMRDSFRFLPKKVFQILYNDLDFGDGKTTRGTI